jgi:hypothetical protein
MWSAAGKRRLHTRVRLSMISSSDRCRQRPGRKMHFRGTTVLRLKDGKIVEEIGLDDGVTALLQLDLIVKAG